MEETKIEKITNDYEDQIEEPMAKWHIHAFPHYERGAFWYILAGIFGGTLLVIAFLTQNFLLAVIIAMVGVVLLIQGTAIPPVIDIEINSRGIQRGSVFYSYKSISRFWIVYDPPIRDLYLITPRSIFSTVHIPIDGQDPTKLRDLLRTYIREDLERDSEPISESLSRIFKI